MTKEEYQSALNALMATKAEIQASICRIEDELRSLRYKAAEELFGLKAGVKLESKTDKKVYVYNGLARYWSDDIASRPWVTGSPLKKDGTPSKMTSHLYDNWRILP